MKAALFHAIIHQMSPSLDQNPSGLEPGPGVEIPQKPSLIRQAAPYLLAGGILVYMFRQVNLPEVMWVLTNPDNHPLVIIEAYLFYCAVYYFTDVLSFSRVYSWFNTPMSFVETLKLRFASYTVQAVNGVLTEIMCVLYMFRVKKVSIMNSTSSMAFVYFNETVSLILLLSFCAFFLPEQRQIQIEVSGFPFWTLFQALVVLALVLALLWVAFFQSGLSGRFPKLHNRAVLLSFRRASLGNYLEIFSYRFGNNLVSLFVNVMILYALGIEAPLWLMFAASPIMVSAAYWPVSAGGFGGPQLAAHFLLKGYATVPEVLAYSLVWSSLFFLTRTLTGLPFLLPVYKAAFPPPKK